MAIHEYGKQYKAAIASLKRCDLSEGNKKTVKEFVNDLILEGLSKPRIIRYIVGMKVLARQMSVNFDEATKDDIKKLVAKIQQRDDYKAWTKHNYKVLIRRFYK